MNVTERFAAGYLTKSGLRPEPFTKAEARQRSTPAFRAFHGEDLLLYCDAKHVQQDEWQDEQPMKAKRRKTVSLIPTPIFHRLSSHIRQAVQRFDAVNPDHRCVNVLLLVNSDEQRGVSDLRKVLTWNCLPKDDRERTSQEEKLAVDLYIWRDEFQPKDKVSGCFWTNPERRDVLLNLLPDKSIWEESLAPREVDPKLRDFVKRVIVPILVNKYLEQVRQGVQSVKTGDAPEVMREASRTLPRLACFL